MKSNTITLTLDKIGGQHQHSSSPNFKFIMRFLGCSAVSIILDQPKPLSASLLP